ncbi:MAG: asparagine synthase (glutamine-hydrolyzing) [Verrucomicrobiota bacterium]
MCGILGRLSKDPILPNSALASLHHRGPDHSATFLNPPFQLGYTRLAILDQMTGNQPVSSPDGRVHAFCNGELYNWREVRSQLESLGYHFHTQCDTEILPAAWLEWGTSLPEKLNGMFALVIHDIQTNSLFLTRDRCGQKPLYYTSRGPFAFASEIKALPHLGHALTPDPAHLATWLSLRYLPEPFTLFQHIQTLPAAHWMTVSSTGEIKTHRYWQPAAAPNPQPHIENLQSLDRLTRSSVELALQSDVPIAAYLSGGVDSALLAHYIRDLGADVTTVSLGFGANNDETTAARHTATHLNLPHHPTQLSPDSLQDLPRVVHQMDRPVGDALILAFDHLAKHTTSLGCKVALGGEGPDEHFAGYSFQRAFLTAKKLGPLGRSLAAPTIDYLPSKIIDQLASFPATLGPEGRSKTSRYLREFSSLPFFHQATRLHTLFEPHEIKTLLHPDLVHKQIDHPIIQSPEQDLLTLQYQHWLPDWSLIRQDKNTMAHSLEYRAPFLDHRLIDFAFTLPLSQKINPTTDKVLWRQLASRHLPREITHRPKQPFYLPLEHPSWRTPLLQLARETLTSSTWLNLPAIEPLYLAKTFLPLKQLAALTILQLWLNQF